MFHGHFDYFQKPPLGGRPNTKPGGHGIPNTRKHWLILFYHVWEPAWIEIHWNSIWLRVRSHMTSHYTWGSVTTLHDFGGVLRRPLDTFFWALTISWSRLLARVWSGPKMTGSPVILDAVTSRNAGPFPHHNDNITTLSWDNRTCQPVCNHLSSWTSPLFSHKQGVVGLEVN